MAVLINNNKKVFSINFELAVIHASIWSWCVRTQTLSTDIEVAEVYMSNYFAMAEIDE